VAPWDLTFGTSYLEPLVKYRVKFVMTKNGGSVSDVVKVYVGWPVAPVLELRSVTFSLFGLDHKIISTELSLAAFK